MIQQSRAPRGALARAAVLGAGLLWAAAARPQEIPAAANEPAFGPVLGRQELLAAVRERNPGIAAARRAWEAALERVPQARSLQDPMAMLGTAPLSLVDSSARPGLQVRVGQRLPFPGTLRLQGEIAAVEAAAAGQRVEEVGLRLATMASLLFDDYYLVERALEVNGEHQLLLGELQSVAASRYGAGLAPQQAPIQAEVEATHLMHRQVVLETRRRVLVAQLNALLHRRPSAPLPAPPEMLEVPSAPDDASDLGETPPSARPEIRAQQEEIAARRATVELKRLDFYPDFEATASYNSMWGAEEHRWMVGVGVSVPIWRKRIRAGVAEAEARLGSAESELASLEDEIRAEILVALEGLRESLHVVRLYRSRVLPATRDQMAAARSGFETGANSMVALIDAERSLRTAELEHYRALADANSRRAELDRAMGRLPFAADAPGAGPDPLSETTETDR